MATVSYKYPYYSTDKSGKWIHYSETFSALIEPSQEYLENKSKESLEPTKQYKIEELTNSCNETIINGCDVTLSDNSIEHFSLTVEDQINLSSAEQAIKNGAESFPYHCKDGSCKVYSAEDIIKIISTATVFKTYHVTYLNCLKEIVNSYTDYNDIYKINAIKYGDDLPDAYQEKLDNIIDSMTQNMLLTK